MFPLLANHKFNLINYNQNRYLALNGMQRINMGIV